MKYVIDGYNVIHQIEDLRNKRLRSQREGLIRLLETHQAMSASFRDLTVVFDGQANVVAPQINSQIRVIFSRGTCADKKIKQIIQSSSFARDIAVVSDDRQIRSYISSLGAKKISVQDFLKKLCATHKRQASFKLDPKEANRINRELEKVWLDK